MCVFIVRSSVHCAFYLGREIVDGGACSINNKSLLGCRGYIELLLREDPEKKC